MKKAKIGDYLKVSNGKEKFWVEIIKILKGLSGPVYKLRIDNKLYNNKKYDYNDIIYIEISRHDTLKKI